MSLSPPNPQYLQGNVERVTFHSEETGFCVLRVKVTGQSELQTVIGSVPKVNPGEYIEARGQWHQDAQHGLQFKAEFLQATPPATRAGIEKFLASGMMKGIGPHFAKKLVKAFGEQVFDIIEQQPERLQELPGIGKKRAEEVTKAWIEQKTVRHIMVFLHSHGIGTARAVRIYRTYGETAVEKVRENPYRLANDIHGIGFKLADELAQRLGLAKDAPQRVAAGLRYVLQECSGEGHCAVTRPDLLEKSCELLGVAENAVTQAIHSELQAENIIAAPIDGQECLFLTPLYKAEQGIAKHIQRLLHGSLPWGKIDPQNAIPWVESQTGLSLSKSQRNAVALAVRSKVIVITGGPGVGKTTLLNSLLKILRTKGVKLSLCAPTGRAAKRLGESTGLEAKTIHRLLVFDPEKGGFKHGEDNPLDTEALVVDEASMVDVRLMNQLLKALPDAAALIIVGDVDQLPSVGPGAVLSDLLKTEHLPKVRLTEIFRQAASSKIIVNAHRINAGDMPYSPKEKTESSDFYLIPAQSAEEIASKLIHVVTERIPKRFGFDPIRDIQVLTPMQRGGLGAKALNVSLQEILNPKAEPRIQRFGWTFAPGDKVIQNVNNYEKEVFNGDIGRILEVDQEESSLLIEFEQRIICYDMDELDEVSLAYVTSIHRSQGSEYPCVVIPLAMQHFMLLERNLLYTAVTRGKNLVVVIAETKALAMAVKNQRARQRLTHLSHCLNDFRTSFL